MGKTTREKSKTKVVTKAVQSEATNQTGIIRKVEALNRPFVHLVLIAIIGILVYSNTLQAPFQWDEKYFMVRNPVVKDLSYFLEPSKAMGTELYDAYKGRYIGYLTFALNYKMHGFEVMGYHIVNISIHLVNAFLVYLFVVLTFKTPFMSGQPLSSSSRYIALLSAALFVSHPVQTEAVTYVFQRLASLVSLFYLLAVVCYIKARLGREKGKVTFICAFLSVLFAVLAMKTKENAFTLPLMITLYEFFFFKGPVKQRMIRLIPLLLTLLIIPMTMIGLNIGLVGDASRGYTGITRWEYLFTQFRVIVTYIRLLFLPLHQNLDYDYPRFDSLLMPPIFLSVMFISGIIGFALYLFRQSRFGPPALRIMAFGIFWFFMALSVESSIVPIPMIICEYRIYLPSVGFFLSLSTAAVYFLGHSKRRVALVVSSVVLILIFSYAAYARNGLWGSRITLWEDVVKKSPNKLSGHNNLGTAYGDDLRIDRAIEEFQAAVRIDPNNLEAHDNLGFIYGNQKRLEEAIMEFKAALRINPNYEKAHYDLGLAYKDQKKLDEAVKEFQAAIKLKPDYEKAHYDLGLTYKEQNKVDEAVKEFTTVLNLNPGHPKAHYNLGIIWGMQNRLKEAINEFQLFLKTDPDHIDAHNNLGVVYGKLNRFVEAKKEFQIVLKRNPDNMAARSNLNAVLKMIK